MKAMRTKRDGIREASLRGEKLRCLMIHFNEENLTRCYHELDPRKAIGIDRVTKEAYGENLTQNVKGLVKRLKSMSYRPQPARQVMIPKAKGKLRPLAISSLEDKIVQSMFKKLLDAVYEPVFLDCSYGFRAGRSAHDAIRKIDSILFKSYTTHTLDIDLENYFGEIPHDKLLSVLGIKISDQRFLRYITRLLRAGVMTESGLENQTKGSPQGSICSPVLANIYAHYCIDVWFSTEVKNHLKGNGDLIRFADDLCLCLSDAADVDRVSKALEGRLSRFGLKLNASKSSVVTLSKRGTEPKGKPTLKFLGFEFFVGKSKQNKATIKVQTDGDKFRKGINELYSWVKRARNLFRLHDLWAIYCSKVRGHLNYFGVSGNMRSLNRFCRLAIGIFFKWINKRSQRRSFNWEKFVLFLQVAGEPKPRIIHRLY